MSVFPGISLAMSAAIGSGLGGWLMANVKISLNKMILAACIVNAAASLFTMPMMAVSCPGVTMVGINE